MLFTRYAFSVFIILSIVIIAGSAPSRQNTGHESMVQKELSDFKKQLGDEEVQELKKLKPGSSILTTKTQKTLYSKNGKSDQSIHAIQQVNKNGEVVERIQQNLHTRQESEASVPTGHLVSEIEIPSKGLHKVYEDILPHELQKKKNEEKHAYDELMKNLFQAIKSKNIVEEMAEYIYETGDENTVTSTIQNYLQLGILSREEALWYLQQIKSILSSFKEEEMRDKKQKQRQLYEVLYENPESKKMDVTQALSDLRGIQEMIQDKYIKQFPDNRDNERSDLQYGRNVEDTDSDDGAEVYESENEYRNLGEKMQVFDNTFSKTSMEGLIYQLAKILFYQSFSMNGLEAQESIKQFTTFLERQVEEGHISHNVERKVFDILLAALTDTLNDHPELVDQRINENRNSNVKLNKTYDRDSATKKSNEKEKTRTTVKSLDLKSSGIQDEPKRSDSKM